MLKNKPTVIGVFWLGHTRVRLEYDPSLGGGFFALGKDNRIIVGNADYDWADMVSTVLHEATEMAMAIRCLRYQHSGKLNGDSADYIFMFDHCQFGRVCSDVAVFIAEALPKLEIVFKKGKKK